MRTMMTCVILAGALLPGCGEDTENHADTTGGSGGQAGEAAEAGAPGIGGSLGVDPAFDGVQVAAGLFNTCARLLDGRVKCWGQNGGVLGLGDGEPRGLSADELGANLPAVDLGEGVTARAVTLSTQLACAQLRDGAVKCWGGNSQGELGQGDTDERGLFPEDLGDALPPIDLGPNRSVREVVAGSGFACAIFESGEVGCWGNNASGQLGLGDTENRGDEPNEMGEQLPLVDLGVGRTALTIVVGNGHSCALLDNHKVKCWGANHKGQLGLGDVEARGDEPGEMGDALPTVELGGDSLVRALAAGEEFTCAVLQDRSVKCWGDNSFGQLGNGDGTSFPRGQDPASMGDFLPRTELGQGFLAEQVTLGMMFGCALSEEGLVKCWGNNEAGQLGLGDTMTRGVEPDTMGDNLPSVELGGGRVLHLDAGWAHVCASFSDNQLKCWGNNLLGGLGLGDTERRGDDPDEMGDALPPVLLDD